MSAMATTPHGGCQHPDAKVEPDFECGVCPWCRCLAAGFRVVGDVEITMVRESVKGTRHTLDIQWVEHGDGHAGFRRPGG